MTPPVILAKAFRKLAVVKQGEREVPMRSREIGTESDRLPECSDSAGEVILCLQCEPQIVPGDRMIGLLCECPAVRRDGVVKTVGGGKCEPEIVVEFRFVRHRLCRLR